MGILADLIFPPFSCELDSSIRLTEVRRCVFKFSIAGRPGATLLYLLPYSPQLRAPEALDPGRRVKESGAFSRDGDALRDGHPAHEGSARAATELIRRY
jgi:hypothetical protein